MPVWAQLWLLIQHFLALWSSYYIKPRCSDRVQLLAPPCLHCTTVDILPLFLFVPDVVLFTFWHLCRLSQMAQCLLSAQSWWLPGDGALTLPPCKLWRSVQNKHRVCKSRYSLRQLFADLNLCFDRKRALSFHLPENCMSLLEVLFSSI